MDTEMKYQGLSVEITTDDLIVTIHMDVTNNLGYYEQENGLINASLLFFGL
jgi:hypothetical protein